MIRKLKNWLFNPIIFIQLLLSVIKKKFIPYYEKEPKIFLKVKIFINTLYLVIIVKLNLILLILKIFLN